MWNCPATSAPNYFYPRPPRGGRLIRAGEDFFDHGFLSTPSARRATVTGGNLVYFLVISIHALREEGDALCIADRTQFDISIHALREEGDNIDFVVYLAADDISIHALREEGDLCGTVQRLPRQTISIHALREEGDGCQPEKAGRGNDFYPRPPRGGRRCWPCAAALSPRNFYPRPPRGGRPLSPPTALWKPLFLSTPSARRATQRIFYFSCQRLFLSTPSARRATGGQIQRGGAVTNFYPRPPRGGRPALESVRLTLPAFLSTPSARRATRSSAVTFLSSRISIHALREEGDSPPALPSARASYFYPRPPRGGRQRGPDRRAAWHSISIHALREEGDISNCFPYCSI